MRRQNQTSNLLSNEKRYASAFVVLVGSGWGEVSESTAAVVLGNFTCQLELCNLFFFSLKLKILKANNPVSARLINLDGKNVGFQVIPLDTSIIANNEDTTEIIGQLSLHEQRKHIPNDK